MKQGRQQPGTRLRVVWGKPDVEEVLAQLERHAEEAIALTKSIHPATVSRLVDDGTDGNAPCPVYDLFSGRRVR